MTALIRTTSLTGYPQLIRELGGDPDQMLKRFNIDPQLLNSSSAVISYRAMVNLLEYSAEQLQCADFGLQLAERQNMMILGPIAVIAQNSSTVGGALHEIAKFLHVYSPGISLEIDLKTDPAHPQLLLEVHIPGLNRLRQITELALCIAHKTLQMLFGSNFRADSVMLRTTTDLPQARYQRFFGAHAYFGQACNALVLRPEHLSKAIDQHNQELHDTLIEYVSAISDANPLDICNQVEQLILRLLPTQRCSLPLIAERLGMRERSLQRRLSERNLLFEDLVDRTRMELADRYLIEAHMPMAQVAGLLGYAEQSSFNRACKRWHAKSPKERRKQLRLSEL
ncbi:AraC family transcriptional regulator [Pseudomonas sp. M30-35]|uniref:AraC family transcriptional regulator n=1 Tax=Pseudomonas sp. M30-35 TaxID=1981174 RepID=UPI000B3CABD4|nr:AraC family transcriptional regulator [Pseudomonas sp. M30-35]ARU86975.1 AraC family transcriptional regulator [Pseudomonas sp. M30-35]